MAQVFDKWFVQVSGQSYGPYTDAMMRRFVGEGRVTGGTPISADPASGFHQAALYAEFRAWKAEPGAEPVALSSRPVARHLVMAELRSGQSVNFLRQLQAYMQSSRIGDTVWLVDGAPSTPELTAALQATLLPGDRLYVVDVTGRDPGTYGFLDMSKTA